MPDYEENIIVVSNLTEYLKVLSEYRRRIIDDEGIDPQRFFFRGQENESWDIRPSIFRKNMLSIESKITQMAYSRTPTEFREHTTPFERLTKLQHYSLSTRLLDVTLNPLVAMFFACKPCTDFIDNGCYTDDDSLEGKLINKNGVVFYQRAYGMNSDKKEIKILSAIAEIEVGNEYTAEQLIMDLENFGIHHDIDNYFFSERGEIYKKLFKILQSNYFVEPNLNNERLIRQSGAFLIPGAINIIQEEDISKSRISKSTTGLDSEFDPVRFIVPFDKKEEILQELDFYNINESTLFPELEHHMCYIKSSQEKYAVNVAIFAKLEDEVISIELDTISGDEIPIDDQFKIDLNSIVEMLVDDKNIKSDITDVFLKSAVLDWHRKESVQSQMRLNIYEVLKKSPKYKGMHGKEIAKNIVAKMIEKVFERVSSETEG